MLSSIWAVTRDDERQFPHKFKCLEALGSKLCIDRSEPPVVQDEESDDESSSSGSSIGELEEKLSAKGKVSACAASPIPTAAPPSSGGAPSSSDAPSSIKLSPEQTDALAMPSAKPILPKEYESLTAAGKAKAKAKAAAANAAAKAPVEAAAAMAPADKAPRLFRNWRMLARAWAARQFEPCRFRTKSVVPPVVYIGSPLGPSRT
eukprot:507995-Pyramimonas_sp.AAC.1